MSKRDERDPKKDEREVRRLTAILWSGSEAERKAALASLLAYQQDAFDVRGAQASLACAMQDPSVEIRRLAVAITRKRADHPCDVNMAFPALSVAAMDRDVEVRRDAWLAIAIADARHQASRRALRPLAERVAREDPDDEVRASAKKALKRAIVAT